MAARRNPVIDAAHRERFYVYRLFDEPLVTLYVGKGSGRRLHNQKRKRRCDGEVIARFKRERDAYAHEVRMIAELQPTENRHPGGTGARVIQRRRRQFAWEREMARIGTRVYAARALLRLGGLEQHISADKIEMLRRVASSA